MNVIVNGTPQTLPDGSTVADLLRALEIGPDGTAVAVDRRVVPRTRHALTKLSNGQEVEVIRAVGGG